MSPVIPAERFKGGQWESLDDLQSFRGYHQTTLLLPSGKVLVAGGESRINDYEIFSPPYMFKPRPERTQDPQESVTYGGTYPVHFTMPSGAALARVVLMRPGCVTHRFDADQRYYQATLDIPMEEMTSPRYTIWLVTTTGVPSVAQWIKVQ